VLAAVVILALGAFNDRGEAAACKADVKAVEVAVEAYRAKNGTYPGSLNDLVSDTDENYLRSLPNTDPNSTTAEYYITYYETTGAVEGRLKNGTVCAGNSGTPGPGSTEPGGGGPGGGEPGGGEPGGGEPGGGEEPGGQLPGVVTGLSVGSVTQTSASISWSAPAGGGQATGYLIQWSTNPQFTGASQQSDNASPFPLSSLSPATTYYVRVAATNDAGTGPWSDGVSFTTLAVGPPSAPQNVTVSARDEDATVRWEAPANNGGAPITEYTVERWKRQGNSCTNVPSNRTSVNVAATARSRTFNDLSEGWHCFRVRANNSAGAGEWSSIVSVDIDD
jgi:type II secretory pathway pseudopilin PulG